MDRISLAAPGKDGPDPLELVDFAAEGSIAAIGLDWNRIAGPAFLEADLIAPRLRALRERLVRTGVGVFDIGPFVIGPATVPHDLAPAVAFAHSVGAHAITVRSQDPDRMRCTERMAELGEIAQTCALDVVVDFDADTQCRTFNAARLMAFSSAQPNVRLMADARRMFEGAVRPEEVLAIDRDLFSTLRVDTRIGAYDPGAHVPKDPAVPTDIEHAIAILAPPTTLAGYLRDLLDALPQTVGVSVTIPDGDPAWR